MFLSAGQTSDYTGAAALLSVMPQAKVLLADRGHDTDSVPKNISLVHIVSSENNNLSIFIVLEHLPQSSTR